MFAGMLGLFALALTFLHSDNIADFMQVLLYFR